MSLINVSDWISEVSELSYVWYAKRLSGNDTLANDSHQAGPYIPKRVAFHVCPDLLKSQSENPDRWIDLYIDSHTDCRRVRVVWYKKAKDECRITNLGGKTSALLDPESTGALAVFAFNLSGDRSDVECRVWVCRHVIEEDLIEELLGPVEPGRTGGRIWASSRALQQDLFGKAKQDRQSCLLDHEELPEDWLVSFPSPKDILSKTLELRPANQLAADSRLMKRRQCEYEIFLSIEEAITMPIIQNGFESLNDFVMQAQTVLQRRKARAGRSLELHTKEILAEEGLQEGSNFSYQPESENGKQPDFLFPSENAYKDPDFPDSKLQMLAVKTTCKDRWRQILIEADRITTKHLLTLQEGISERQFEEMRHEHVQLVVPAPLISKYPQGIRQHLLTLESFICDVRLLPF